MKFLLKMEEIYIKTIQLLVSHILYENPSIASKYTCHTKLSLVFKYTIMKEIQNTPFQGMKIKKRAIKDVLDKMFGIRQEVDPVNYQRFERE